MFLKYVRITRFFNSNHIFIIALIKKHVFFTCFKNVILLNWSVANFCEDEKPGRGKSEVATCQTWGNQDGRTIRWNHSSSSSALNSKSQPPIALSDCIVAKIGITNLSRCLLPFPPSLRPPHSKLLTTLGSWNARAAIPLRTGVYFSWCLCPHLGPPEKFFVQTF